MFFAVLENVAGSVVVRAGADAQAGANSHEFLLGVARPRVERKHFAAQTDPRIDLRWMRVRHELDFTRERKP